MAHIFLTSSTEKLTEKERFSDWIEYKIRIMVDYGYHQDREGWEKQSIVLKMRLRQNFGNKVVVLFCNQNFLILSPKAKSCFFIFPILEGLNVKKTVY